MEKMPSENILKEKAQYQLKSKDLERDLVTYLTFFDKKIDDFRGKEVLDIGSGSAEFAKEAKIHGINVTAVDPIYMLKEGRERFYKEKFWRKIKRFITREKRVLPQAVAALGSELPFRDGQFDIITSVYAAFYYSENRIEIEKNLKEALRVLKKGGHLIIHPILHPELGIMMQFHDDEKEEELNQAFNELVYELGKEGKIKIAAKDSLKFFKHMLNPPDGLEYQGYLDIEKISVSDFITSPKVILKE